MLLWVIVIPIAVLLAALTLVFAVGSRMPAKHSVTVRKQIGRQPDQLWAIISDFPGQTKWRTGIKNVERSSDKNGHEVWMENSKGQGKILLEITESVKGRRLVRKIAIEKLPFGGEWVIELKAEGTGTEITVTENGEVYNAFFRFISRMFMDMSSSIRVYVADLESYVEKLNQEKK